MLHTGKQSIWKLHMILHLVQLVSIVFIIKMIAVVLREKEYGFSIIGSETRLSLIHKMRHFFASHVVIYQPSKIEYCSNSLFACTAVS